MTVFVLLETILEQTEADGLTVDLMCSASAPIMFLLIRVVGVLESIPAGIHPGLVPSPSQDTHKTYTHAVTEGVGHAESTQRDLENGCKRAKRTHLLTIPLKSVTQMVKWKRSP